jgi:hypothetical protein
VVRPEQEIEMEKELKWKVIEDNGGGLHLFVHEYSKLVYSHSGYEYNPGQLTQDIKGLESGSDPTTWDGNENSQESYDGFYDESRRNGGWDVVVKGCTGLPTKYYYPRMGRAAQIEFAYSEPSESKTGRPPLYGATMRQTAVYLPEAMIEWLKAQPDGVSATMRRLIDDAMKNE